MHLQGELRRSPLTLDTRLRELRDSLVSFQGYLQELGHKENNSIIICKAIPYHPHDRRLECFRRLRRLFLRSAWRQRSLIPVSLPTSPSENEDEMSISY